METVFRLDPRRLQLEKFHSRKPIESLSDIKLEKERETGRAVENVPMPLPPSLYISPPRWTIVGVYMDACFRQS